MHMGIAQLSPAAAQAANYFLQVPPPPLPKTPPRTDLDGVVISMFVFACCCLVVNVGMVLVALEEFAKSGWRTDARRRSDSLRGAAVIAALIGVTLLPPVLVVALVPGAAYRFGMAWTSLGFAVTPLLGLAAGVAVVEWRRWRCRCWAGHPVIVQEPQPVPATRV